MHRLLLPLLLAACAPLSEREADPAAGWNGGFEKARNGLPVNWLVSTPKTVPDAEFEVALDRDERREGRQSLRFVVERCSAAPGRLSPGIAQEIAADSGRAYAISFWIKSSGCAWDASFGGVTAKTGDARTIDGAGVPRGVWSRVESVYVMPPGMERLRFTLDVLSPGRLWIDDVRVDPVE